MRALLAFLVAGCGGPATMSTDPPPPAHGFQLATGTFHVPAGAEKYYCFAHTLSEPGPVAITAFTPYSSASVHHVVVFKTLAPEPEGFSECPVLVKTSWLPLFAGGRNANGLKLPDGAGFPVAANEQILLQLHLLNATAADVDEKVFVNMDYAPDASQVTPAGIFALGSMTLNIPANTQGYQVKTECNADKQLEVFAAFPHMHKMGVSAVLERGASAMDATTIYKRDPWVFGDQPMDPLPLTIAKGDFLRATCTYDNPTAAPVTFGESTSNEMCYMVLFYTPFDHLDGCIN